MLSDVGASDGLVEAGIRLASGEVYATFRSVIPTTGLPPGVETGFLPPENGTGRGQGHIGYVIRAHTNLTTGTEIRNVAFITFDIQPAIRTDQVDPQNASLGIDTNKQALVTIDADEPTSMIVGTVGPPSARFTLCWSGGDVGSGIAGYDVYVRSNGGAWTLWLANTPDNCATFHGRNSVVYEFYSVARDHTGQLEPPPTNADHVVVTPPCSPPELAPIPNVMMNVNQTLAFTNVADDPDESAQTLSFSLTDAPPGASIGEHTGVFRWTPACGQGNSTNRIRVRVTDHCQPAPLSATQTFLVTVRECVEASLGNTVMLAGSSNAVLSRLESNVELTNLFFTVVYAPERFTNFVLHPNTNAVPAGLGTNRSAGQYFVSFDLPANRILRGPTNVGELSFSAVPDQPSAFVPLPVVNVDGRKPNGERVANAYGYPGRVTVVGREPLLEAALLTNGLVELTLYAPPGATVRLESADHLPATLADWMPLLTVSNQAVIQVLPPLPASGAMRFIRAVRP